MTEKDAICAVAGVCCWQGGQDDGACWDAGACGCKVVPHRSSLHPNLSEASSVARGWKPRDRARVLFRDGVRRPAELTPGFVWVSLEGDHLLNAVGGFDAEPMLRVIPPGETTKTPPPK